MEDLKQIQEFFSKPLNENIVVRMYNITDKTADLYKEDNPGLEFYLTGKKGQDYVRKYKDHISFPFSSHMNDGTPIPNYEENKEKLTAYLKQKGIPFKTTSTKPLRGVSRTTGEDYMATTDTFKVPLSHVDIKDISLNENKVTKEDFDKVVKVLSKSKYPFTIMLVPKWGEIDIITGQDSPDEIVDDISQRLDSVGLNWGGNSGITISGDSSNYSRREYSDIFKVNGGHKDYFEESVNEMDINDPIMMRMRAAKDAIKNKKPDLSKEYGDAVQKAYNSSNLAKLNFLRKERAQLMRDMEQEAEPEGGPIADEYGSKLDSIDKAIAKLSGRKEMTYDQAIAENVNMPSQEEVDKFFALTQQETHYLNSKPVMGQEGTFNLMPIEPWDEYDYSNWMALVRRAKQQGKSVDEGFFDRFKSKSNPKNATDKVKDPKGVKTDKKVEVQGKNVELWVDQKNQPYINYEGKFIYVQAPGLKVKYADYKQPEPSKDSEEKTDTPTTFTWSGDDLKNTSKSIGPEYELTGKSYTYKNKSYPINVNKKDKREYFQHEDGRILDIKFIEKNTFKPFKKKVSETLAETIKLGEGVIEEELCPKGKAYIKRRKAAGEKSSAYLSGRAVKVCKGQMSGRKKRKSKKK